MAEITTYGTLQDAIGDTLNRSEYKNAGADVADTKGWIALAEDTIARDERIRVREMEHTLDLYVTATINISDDDVAGTANAITLTPDTAATAYTAGDSYSFKATNTNTAATTVDISGLGTKSIVDEDGSTALEAGAIVDNANYHIYYDGTSFLLIPRGSVPLPSRFLAARNLYLDTNPVRVLEYMAPHQFWQIKASNTTGRPVAYTITGERLILGPASDATRQIKMNYYRRNAALSADSDTNWIIDDASMLLLSASMIEAVMFLRNDSAVLKWAARYDDMADRIKQANKKDRFSGAPLVSRSDSIIEGSRAAGSRRLRT
jgi:hypothetical protein|tara:strand:+ start:67 stop:1023 length:957 start_codon:yes stop_codon:yes gene_type:complete